MKRIPSFVLPVVCLAALAGCTPTGTPGAVGGSPIYHGYYGRGFYNETPPGTYYGPNSDSGPYYGGGNVAVVHTDVYNDRIYREQDHYSRDGRRYNETGKREYFRAKTAGKQSTKLTDEQAKRRLSRLTREQHDPSKRQQPRIDSSQLTPAPSPQ